MKLIRDLFLLFVGGSIATAGNYFVSSTGNEIPYIDKHVITDISIISKENLFSRDVKILVGKEEKEKEVEEISRATVYLFNYSDEFFKDMEIRVKINNPDGKVKLLSTHALGDSNEDSIIKPIKSNSVNSFKYLIKTAKRTDRYDEFFKLIIYYEGDHEFDKDDFTVTPLNAEARTRDYDRSHSPENTKYKLWRSALQFGALCGALIFSISFIKLMSVFTRNADKKSSRRYATKLYNSSEKTEMFRKFSNEERKSVISKLLYEHRLEIWKKSSKFELFLGGSKEPAPEDFKVLEASKNEAL